MLLFHSDRRQVIPRHFVFYPPSGFPPTDLAPLLAKFRILIHCCVCQFHCYLQGKSDVLTPEKFSRGCCNARTILYVLGRDRHYLSHTYVNITKLVRPPENDTNMTSSELKKKKKLMNNYVLTSRTRQ